jgi:hypothetical protein
MIGSEKAEFFSDPDVVKALAAKGYRDSFAVHRPSGRR